MSERIMCDFCGANGANTSYKISVKTKSKYRNAWSSWRHIDICNQCVKKLFGRLPEYEYPFPPPPPLK